MCRWLVKSSSRWVQGWKGWGMGAHSCLAALLTCLFSWQVLIGDEPECGMENLLEVQVPEDVERQLQQLDQEQQEPRVEGTAPT